MKSLVVLSLLGVVALASFAYGCIDNNKHCAYMQKNCKKSCGICGGGGGGGSGQCGYKPSVRIVGGTEAPKGAWPWQAQVRTSSGFTFCGGTLVHPQRVVTAAHCTIKKTASSIRVRLGAHYRSSTTGTEQDFQVERIVNHHSYKKPRGMPTTSHY